MPLPPREPIAGIESQTGRRNRRHPEHQRLLHSFLIKLRVDTWTKIEASGTDEVPAVVFPRLQHVDLIAAVWSVLAFPNRSGVGLHRQSKHVAMPHRVDLRAIASATHEGV